MKLTKDQINEIKDLQSQKNTTKRATVFELEKINEAIPALDHGFIRVIDYMGDDSSIVQLTEYHMEKELNKSLRIVG